MTNEITDDEIIAACKAACFHVTPESAKDMRNAMQGFAASRALRQAEQEATEQSLGLYAAQASDIKDLLDKHAPDTTGNMQTRLAQVFERQAEQEPVARLEGIDEYGPILGWFLHWANLPVGAKLYAAPQLCVPKTAESNTQPDLSLTDATQAEQEPEMPAVVGTAEAVNSSEFIQMTNEDYSAWCRTYYQAEDLDDRGMVSLHGLWAWQEQERRKIRVEPVAIVAVTPNGGATVGWYAGHIAKHNDKLYAAPQPAKVQS